MNRTPTLFILVLASVPILSAQGITIGNGTLFSLAGATLSLSNNWTNSGTFNAGTGTVTFNGPSGQQTIANVSGETFQNLVVNKAAGDVVLSNNITVNGNLTTTSGDLDLNGKTVTLGSGALLSETAGNTVKGTSGVLTTTRTLGASPGNVAGLGLDIAATALALGSTTITRGHSAQTGDGHYYGILRYYTVSPSTNNSLGATVIFDYDDGELNGLTESTLQAYSSSDGGSTWSLLNGTLNTTNNTYTLNGQNSLTRYTLASTSAPLPVELVSFRATGIGTKATLTWQTATETNSFGFEIQRRREGETTQPSTTGTWEKVGFSKAAGTTSSLHEYTFNEDLTLSGRYAYRLKQLDNGGASKYSGEAYVEISIPRVLALHQNYPNPFNPSTTLEFTLEQNGKAAMRIYNLLGQEVATVFDQDAEAGRVYRAEFNAARLTSGVYVSVLDAGGRRLTRKILLVK